MTRRHYELIIGGVLLVGLLTYVLAPGLFNLGVNLWKEFLGL